MSKKTLYFNKALNYTVSAATEDGRLVDCEIEKDDGSVREGNIYKGVIKSILDGMQAAFVDCGLERSCYIAAEDLSPYGSDMRRLNFKEGDEITVQVVKPPIGKKGAKVTTHLSFAGKSLIYLPETDFVGVSHKITDKELRESLIMEAKKAKRNGEGLVIRSAAPFCTYENMVRELDLLRGIYQKTTENSKNIKTGLIYSDRSLPVRILRDNDIDGIEKIVTGSEDIWNEIRNLTPLLPALQRIDTELYAGTRDMLEEYGIISQILNAVSPKVELEGGANLVIEHTEALTVIDVNTGKFVGADNLEETVYHTNLAAAREIARQVKLRNIGGIVVVDFIDMKQENHRSALVYELNKALANDTAKCKVLPMSDFGLVQFTRRRTGKGLSDALSSPCIRCGGMGRTLSEDIIILTLRAQLLRLLSEGADNILVEADSETAENAANDKLFTDDLHSKFPFAEITFKADAARPRGNFSCKAVKPKK